ncbi:hypothetical protein HYDPIDRAFT_85017 [Hydnomerulius pinastri MD-312]|nr:hypothetical protein HYDPIDRAFT_85017 [Hydnomerulius pinastri MD-312]
MVTVTNSPPPIHASINSPARRNILMVGDVGVGKSSLVNLIAGERVASTSDGARSCTLHSQEHLINLDSVQLALHDTAGLHEAIGKMKTDAYLDAVFQAYALISKLERSGGINLIVFCMKAGRISESMQQTYNLFTEVLCKNKVPVVIAVTHLEAYENMEDWWSENAKYIKDYGLHCAGHACVTATKGYRDMFQEKYTQSREVMRNLLLEYSDQRVWKEGKATWIKRVMVHFRQWMPSNHAKRLQVGRKQLKKKLMKKCGFSAEDAEAVAHRIVETGESNEDEGASDDDRVWLNDKDGVHGDKWKGVEVLPSYSYH